MTFVDWQSRVCIHMYQTDFVNPSRRVTKKTRLFTLASENMYSKTNLFLHCTSTEFLCFFSTEVGHLLPGLHK